MAYSVHGLSFPARKFIAVTPSDTVDLPAGCVGLYIGTTGNLSVKDIDGTTVLFSTLPVGYAPIGPVRIMATNTTADDIVALYA
jgi:hypothetical protein